MKKLLVALTPVLLACCQKTETTGDPYPIYLVPEKEWIVFEGEIPIDDQLHGIELKLKPAPVGAESYFRLHANAVARTASLRTIFSWYGADTYETLYAPDGKQVIRLKIRNHVFRGKGKKPMVYEKQLFFLAKDDHELILLDDNLDVVSPGFNLYRRSDLFTAEGYFTVEPDTSDFFEQNTLVKWPVARLASYDEAVVRYRSEKREKFEGMYLKALAYSVRRIGPSGNEVDAIVFKKILNTRAPEQTTASAP